MIYSRSNAEHIKSEIMKNANGIGSSKSQAKNNSDIKGQNGQNVSTKAHSIKSTEALRSATNQYVDYVKDNYSGRVADNINNDTVKDFIDKKSGEIAGNSLNTMISTLAKMADNFNELGMSAINRDTITDFRSEFKESGINLRSENINRAYENPREIIAQMQETPYGLSALLQLELGLRSDDCLNAHKWSLNDDKTLSVSGSKNGLDYTTAMLSDSLYEKVTEAIENNYHGNYDEYRELLKEVTQDCGEKWTGTHGLRFNFAQCRIEELREQNFTESECLSICSLELGHSRIEISEHYLA